MTPSTTYPDTFAWGFTWSATQAEGAAPAADWSLWERSGRVPSSGEGAGFRVDSRDDLALIADLGVNAVRIGIEWARIEPSPGKVDSAALDWYGDMVRFARSVGLAPWLTLHSTTLPGWFSDDSAGFRDRTNIDRYWLPHVERCAERFAGIASGWTLIDDPIGWAMRGYLLGSRPPGRHDPAQCRAAISGALHADHRGAQLLASGREKTMAVRHTPPVFALGASADTNAARWRHFLWDSWIGLLFDGVLSLPDQAAETHPEWVGDFDYVGINFEGPIGVDAHGDIGAYPSGARVSDSGFVPLADELFEVLAGLSDRVNRPLVVASNGVATTDDEWRESHLDDTIATLDTAVADGIDIVGYFHNTAIDGYEFARGFSTQRGVVTNDRGLKDSAIAYQKHIAARRSIVGRDQVESASPTPTRP